MALQQQRGLPTFIKRLRVRAGDIIAIKAGTYWATEEGIERLKKELRHRGIIGWTAVVLDELDDIVLLNPSEMLKYGWIREEVLALDPSEE